MMMWVMIDDRSVSRGIAEADVYVGAGRRGTDD